jgi:beta-glucosidase/6-phospho-beta-glucosidase/beta-galactosidase
MRGFATFGAVVLACASVGLAACASAGSVPASDDASVNTGSGSGSGGGYEAGLRDASGPGDQDSPSDATTAPVDAGSGPDGSVSFPPDFVFGTAIAGFQADMGCPTLDAAACDDPNSDWFAFTTNPTTVQSSSAYLSGQNPAVVGPGFWELYPDDIRRADQELHNQSLRLSIEWSRIFPTATDNAADNTALRQIANSDAIARYHAIFAELKKRNMRPLVTLNHYTLPSWLHDAVGCHTNFSSCSPRGWVDSTRAVTEGQKYAGFVAEEFGGEVDWWATINEPLQNMLFGYIEPSAARAHPPAVSLQQAAAKTVFGALVDIHARMYDAIKQYDTVDADGDGKASWVGVVYPFVPVAPASSSKVDVQAAKNVDYLWNRAYLNAVALGEYDTNLDGKTTLRSDLVNRMDYIGINWYGGLQVTGLGFSLLSTLSPLFTANPLNIVQTDNQPDKLASFVNYVNVTLGKPAIITENGTTGDDYTACFIASNLRAVANAIASGADIRGYYYWTLMDNYEWNHGMNIRMGLYAVSATDPAKVRVARSAVATYGIISASHAVPGELFTECGLSTAPEAGASDAGNARD